MIIQSIHTKNIQQNAHTQGESTSIPWINESKFSLLDEGAVLQLHLLDCRKQLWTSLCALKKRTINTKIRLKSIQSGLFYEQITNDRKKTLAETSVCFSVLSKSYPYAGKTYNFCLKCDLRGTNFHHCVVCSCFKYLASFIVQLQIDRLHSSTPLSCSSAWIEVCYIIHFFLCVNFLFTFFQLFGYVLFCFELAFFRTLFNNTYPCLSH